MRDDHAFRSGGSTNSGDLYIRFKVNFPRKLARSVSGDSDDAKKSLEDLRQLLGQKSENGSASGTKGGVFSRGWWSRGSSDSDDSSGSSTSDGGSEKPALVARRASAAQERALAAAEHRQTSERERAETF